MTIKTQFSDCGCALMEDENGELSVQPGLGCEREHDWALIIAGLKNEHTPLFEDARWE